MDNITDTIREEHIRIYNKVVSDDVFFRTIKSITSGE